MSSFTTPLVGEYNDAMDIFTLMQPFIYRVGSVTSTEIITVPEGFATDFASTPFFIQWLLPHTGLYGKAAVLHDYLYQTGMYDREKCDNIFLEAMQVLGVSEWKAVSMHKAVRIFGKQYYKGIKGE